ncbi:MAG: DUF1127 domain-containing protein [Rhodospirillales bacterium]
MYSILRVLPLTSATARSIISAVIAVFALPERGLDLLVVWEQRLKQRHALATMDARLLDDMGLSARDAAHEAAKPFWRA